MVRLQFRLLPVSLQMHTANFILLLQCLLAIVPASSQNQFPVAIDWTGEEDDSFIPFKKFIDQVGKAEYQHYAAREVETDEAFREMKEHVLYMYSCVESQVTSFVLDTGHVDCIKITEQPSYCHAGMKEIAKPPPIADPPTGPSAPIDVDFRLKQGLTDRFGNRMSCPQGTIPMSRLSLKQMSKFPNLRRFFAKYVPPTFPHKRAYGYQKVPNLGGSSMINIWNPPIPPGGMS
jgi:hypothetical protein